MGSSEILVVEDTSASLKLLTDILTKAGYKVRPASDGELALRSILIKPPTLVLLDIRMPGIDGYEVCRRLKADDKTKDIPIIFLSSLSDVVDKVMGFQLGAVDYITKPYNKEELLARVQTHVDLYRLKSNLEELVRERTAKLRESEGAYKQKADELRIVADYASDWEYWMGDEGRFIYISPSCEEITGYPAEAFYADPKLMMKILHPEDKTWYWQHSFDVIRNKNCCAKKELRIINKDGIIRYIEHSCRTVIGDDGVWLGQRGSNRDITERKKAQEMMRQSEEQFQKLFNVNPIPLGFVEQDGTIKYLNSRFFQTFGYSHEEIPTVEDWWRLAYPNPLYREWVVQTWNAAIQKAVDENVDIEPIEYEVTCKNGKTKIVEISGIVTGNNFLATFFDVTERKEAQEILKRSNELLEKLVKDELEKSREKDYMLIKQSRLAAMGEMISNIAHQWRQPLNALGLLVQGIREAWRYGELNDEYVDNAVKLSLEQIHYMSQTIDDFRSFFKPDKEKTTFSLLDVAHRAEHLLLAGLTVIGVKLRINIVQELSVTGYENELAQVFLNIIKNSKDAIVEKGVLNPTIEISAQENEHEIVITIKDNGGGIDEAIIDKIFEPYFTTKEQGKGTGIGLYMTKTIIEQNMGGKITARNEDGGAVFEIRLG